MPTPTPQVIEKQNVDIDFSKGLNEKDRPESMDWTKGVKVAENVTFDEPGVINQRPSVGVLDGPDEIGYSDTSDLYGPLQRVMSSGDGVIAIGRSGRLFQVNEAEVSVTPKNLFSEFSMEPNPMGSWPVSGDEVSKVVGTALTTKHKVLLHTAKSQAAGTSGTTSAYLAARLVVSDISSGNIVRQYSFNEGVSVGTATYALTVVGDRYIHVYCRKNTGSGGDATSALLYQFDTNALPDSPPSPLVLSQQADIIGCVANSASSVVLLSNFYLVRCGTTPTATDSQLMTGWASVSSIDTDGTDIFVVGINDSYDPAVLGLTGFWQGPYGGSPWTGTASAGSSGSRNLTQATNAPDVGTSVNGHEAADFESANLDYFDSATVATLFTAGAGTISVLIKPESKGADDAAGWGEDAIVYGGYVAMVCSTSGMRAALYDGGWKYTAYQSLPNAAWAACQVRWNGTNLESRVNNGTWQTVAAGNITVTTDTVQVGRNSNAVRYLDGEILDVITANTRLSDTECDDIITYYESRYGLSL